MAFSGPLPYEIAKKYIGTDKIMVYVPATESGLYKSLLEMIYEQGRIIEKLSIDTMSLNNISEEALSQLHIKKPQIYTKVFDLDIDMEELLNFHMDLWEKGKTSGALTCFPSVCDSLREHGIPSYKMSMSKMEIDRRLEYFLRK